MPDWYLVLSLLRRHLDHVREHGNAWQPERNSDRSPAGIAWDMLLELGAVEQTGDESRRWRLTDAADRLLFFLREERSVDDLIVAAARERSPSRVVEMMRQLGSL